MSSKKKLSAKILTSHEILFRISFSLTILTPPYIKERLRLWSESSVFRLQELHDFSVGRLGPRVRMLWHNSYFHNIFKGQHKVSSIDKACFCYIHIGIHVTEFLLEVWRGMYNFLWVCWVIKELCFMNILNGMVRAKDNCSKISMLQKGN